MWYLTNFYSFTQAGLPQINFVNLRNNSSAGTLIADSVRTTFEGRGDDALKWRTWPAYGIKGPSLPWIQLIVMNETSEGERPQGPKACASGQQWVRSPYNAMYTYCSC
jgi:hypothetical protein